MAKELITAFFIKKSLAKFKVNRYCFPNSTNETEDEYLTSPILPERQGKDLQNDKKKQRTSQKGITILIFWFFETIPLEKYGGSPTRETKKGQGSYYSM